MSGAWGLSGVSSFGVPVGQGDGGTPVVIVAGVYVEVFSPVFWAVEAARGPVGELYPTALGPFANELSQDLWIGEPAVCAVDAPARQPAMGARRPIMVSSSIVWPTAPNDAQWEYIGCRSYRDHKKR